MGLIRDAVTDYAGAVAISYANVWSAGEGPVINEISGRRPPVPSMSSACVWRHSAASHRTGSQSWARETWPRATWVISTNAAFYSVPVETGAFFLVFFLKNSRVKIIGKLRGFFFFSSWRVQCLSRFLQHLCLSRKTHQLLVFGWKLIRSCCSLEH